MVLISVNSRTQALRKLSGPLCNKGTIPGTDLFSNQRVSQLGFKAL